MCAAAEVKHSSGSRLLQETASTRARTKTQNNGGGVEKKESNGTTSAATRV